MSMLSLGDDIFKFDKIAQTLKDDTMTLDEKFMGGGLTIQDILQENNFIITEMRKMKQVFLNYCQLNQKVYKKIMEHQMISNEHLRKITTAESNIDSKLKSVVDDFRIAKQKFNKQNESIKQEFQHKINENKAQLSNKVNQQGFVERIKLLIQQFDSEPSSEQHMTDNNTDNNNTDNNNTDNNNTDNQGKKCLSPLSPNKKRKKGLTLEDINNVKSEITPLIDEVSEKISQHNLRFSEIDKDVSKLKPIINKLSQETNWINDSIKQIKINSEQKHQALIKAQNQIRNEIKEAINQEIWAQKFNDFNIEFVKHPLKSLYKDMSEMKYSFQLKLDEIPPKFTNLQKKLQKINLTINKDKEQMKKIKQDIQSLENQEKKTKEKVQQIKINFKQFLKSIEKVWDKIKKQESSRKEEDQILDKKISGIVETTEQKVLKKVQNRFGKQLRDVRVDIVNLGRKASEISTNVKANIQQVTHVKDVVSKKANFTDLVICCDRKADKVEYKQLQELINSPVSNKMQQYSTQYKMQNQNSKKRRSSYSKGFGYSNYTKQQTDSGKKISFGQDINNEETKQLLFKNGKSVNRIRHKSQRPSTATTLFML